ncbi:peptidyl-prolyl cis-trans isomerase-like 1 isoform X2 [Scyliorhinus canicula]|uniref:peptidyl-prolyl cis-trans isomerase-like 1 isoform X2 n=1 Tax=Scyliorhinus canicula TaxID=7830 RepID=UPI0018F6ACE8|nr:peptidyl-prolyl cis-trans isomerase-like 1 isoform X2 [Scyliorhinus canicula]
MSGIPPDTWQPQSVTLDTTMGTILLELYWKHAPKTCRNFAELIRRGYYNGTKFHRVISGFVIQGGDPTGTGAGILAMANAGPDTNGSQFFITLGPTPLLDGKHTVFGRVSHGLSVVKRIELVETNRDDRPTDDVIILKAIVNVSH